MPKPAHAKNALHYVYVVSTGQKYKTWEEAAAVLLKKLIEKSLQEDYWFLYGVLS